MAATKVNYDSTRPIGGELAQAVDHLRRGLDLFNRAKAAIDSATDGGTNKNVLTGADFGAADNTNASLMWDAAYSINYVMSNAVAGGLSVSLAALDKGLTA